MAERKKRPLYVQVMGGSMKGSKVVHPGCPIHLALRDAALDKITEPPPPPPQLPPADGYFEKAKLLEEVRLPGSDVPIDVTIFADNVHWDYIVKNLEEEFDAELIPLAQHFFSKVAKDQKKALRHELADASREAEKTGDWDNAKKLASRSIASGHGKKTVGYAQFAKRHGLLVVAQRERTRARANGVIKSADGQDQYAARKGISAPSDALALPTAD